MDLIDFLFENLFHIYILVTNLDRRFEVKNGNIIFWAHRFVLKGFSLLSLGNGYEEGVEGREQKYPPSTSSDRNNMAAKDSTR